MANNSELKKEMSEEKGGKKTKTKPLSKKMMSKINELSSDSS
jgi:hypothetical protein